MPPQMPHFASVCELFEINSLQGHRMHLSTMEPNPPHSRLPLPKARSGSYRWTRSASAVSEPMPLSLACGTIMQYHRHMKRAHRKTLEAVFARPTSANIAWKDIEALLIGLGAEVTEREGSRVAIVLFQEVRVFHRPHPSPKTDKGAVVSVKRWLEQHGVKP